MSRKTTLDPSRRYSTDKGHLKTSGAAYDHYNVDCAPDRRPKPNGSAQSSLQVFKWPNAAHSWDDPDSSILDDRRGELPEFPLRCLTGPWQAWIEGAAHGAGVTPGHIAVPLLGVASSLIGMARCVRASCSWSEPLTLWTCLVAPSGDRKTPALRVTLRALDLIEANNSAAITAARLAHETRSQKSKEATKRWKDERRAALTANPVREAPPMPVDAIDPGDFVFPRLYATDPTIASLAPLLSVRPRGMILVRDELSGLFSNMDRYGRGSDRPFWLESWNGGRHVVERVSKSIVIDHLLIGVIGGFQPDKLARAFAGDEDGMCGRFLYGWPSAPDYRPLTNDVADVDPRFQSAVNALIRLPAEDADGHFAPQHIWLSQPSIDRFEEFRRYIDQTKRRLDGREWQWFVKGETQVLRLAGTLAYMAWAMSLRTSSCDGVEGIAKDLEPRTIEEEFLLAAIRLWREYFWPHARAALRLIGLTDRHADSRRALRWIIAHAKYEVSREEIRREALGQSLDAEQTQHLLDRLVKAGWLQSTSSVTGGRKRHRWQVQSQNPRCGNCGNCEKRLRMEPPITAFQLLALSALLAPDEQRGGYNLGYGRRENIQCSPSRSGWRHISRRSDDAEDGRRERPRRIERISAPSLERRANETMTWSIPEVGTVGKGKV